MIVHGPNPRARADSTYSFSRIDRRAAHGRHIPPPGDGQNDDHLFEPLPEDNHKAERHHDQGQGELHIHRPHDETFQNPRE